MDNPFTLFMVAISPPAHAFFLGIFAMTLFREVKTGNRTGIWFTISALSASILIVGGSALGAWIFGLGWTLLLSPLCVYAGVRLEPKIKARLAKNRHKPRP